MSLNGGLRVKKMERKICSNTYMQICKLQISIRFFFLTSSSLLRWADIRLTSWPVLILSKTLLDSFRVWKRSNVRGELKHRRGKKYNWDERKLVTCGHALTPGCHTSHGSLWIATAAGLPHVREAFWECSVTRVKQEGSIQLEEETLQHWILNTIAIQKKFSRQTQIAVFLSNQLGCAVLFRQLFVTAVVLSSKCSIYVLSATDNTFWET